LLGRARRVGKNESATLERKGGLMRRIRWQSGQTTAEYALVLLAAAAVAVALYIWATESTALNDFFNTVIEKVQSAIP
jgi:Flp pilus assembly pilin Flp